MQSARGNEEMIMFSSRDAICVFLRREQETSLLRTAQIRFHLARNCFSLRSQIDSCVGTCVEKIIALILRIVHAEMGANVLGERMHLQREVSPSHGVEQIEANGEIMAEVLEDAFPHQPYRFE